MKVAVLGAGVTGLTAAWRLAQAGHEVRVFEAGPKPGGFVRTEASGGWLFDAGPNTFLESPGVAGLIGELGLGGERVASDPAVSKRYVALRGKLVPLPGDPAGLLTTPVFSALAKMRIAAESGRTPIARPADVSVAELVRDHFGDEVLARLGQPLVGGICAGDAERLSAQYAFPKLWEAEKSTGSLVRAAMGAAKAAKPGKAITFRSGLQALTSALAGKLPAGSVNCAAAVRALSAAPGSRWRVGLEGAADAPGEFDRVIAALPAWALASLEIGGQRPLAALSSVEHPPLATVFLGYRRQDVSHPLDGFGALIPAAEKRSVIGIIFSSSLFPGRAPEGCVAVTAVAGGAVQPAAARLGADALLETVRRDVAELLGARGEPVFSRRAVWPRSIPQYNLGYGEVLGEMARCEVRFPGLLIGGMARDGISLPSCIASGESLAKRVS